MKEISGVVSTLGGMPAAALIATIVLAGFALAAFAIYAVMRISKGRQHGD
jgi:hypothetical protein